MNHHLLPTSSSIPKDWCIRTSEYPRSATVHQLFEEQARVSPLAVAVSDLRQELSYRELNRKADLLASFLGRSGVVREEGVAILMRRSVSMVVAMLAILKAGATYVPIDENCPASRLQLILEDAGIKVVLTDEQNLGRMQGMPVTAVNASAVREEADAAGDPGFPVTSCDPLGRAYIMYTSGSTGTPKGVEVVHRGIVRLVRNTDYVEFGPTDVVAQIANPAFDAITFEVWGALLNGARLCILESETVLSPHAFERALHTQGVTIMFLTSSLFSVLAATVPAAFGGMRTLVVGGDAVNPEAARTVLATAPPLKLVNGYGPTECTTFSICHWIRKVPLNAKSIPIGRPIANSEAFILDQDLRMLPPGEAGDLYLGGDGLARGYLNQPELTRDRFLAHPFKAAPGARLYKTGDRARYLEDGKIEFLGRLDHQVKFHGFRIELGEIESALRMHPDVIDAAAKVVHASTHDDRLAAFVATGSSERLTECQLRTFLEERLPNYMVPSHIAVMSELPRNGVGKVDRNSLPDPLAASDKRNGETASNQLEREITSIWKQVLSLPAVGVEESFFDVGGTSLTLALVAHQLAAVAGRTVETTDLFRYPTIRSLAGFLSGAPNIRSRELLQEAQARAARQRSILRARPLPANRANS